MRKSGSGKVGMEGRGLGHGLAFVMAAALVAFTPRAGHAQSDCALAFQGCPADPATCSSATGSPIADGGSLCLTAVNKKCSFQVALCVNPSGCTAQNLKHKKVRATGHCGPVGKVFVKGNGTNSACGTFAGITVRTKKHGTKAGTCTISAKAGKGPSGDKDKITLTCQPTAGLCPTLSTTTTTITRAIPTTTSTGPPCTNCLSFVTGTGTTNCGSAGLASAPSAPFAGEIDSDTAGTTKISDLGLGCLYVGGGNANTIPPGPIPSGATSYFDVSGTNLNASNGRSIYDCTKGAGPGKHCINAACNVDADCDGTAGSCTGGHCMPGTQNPLVTGGAPLACTTDNDCGGAAGTCALDAKCYFGPPLQFLSPPPAGALTTCVINVVEGDAAGTGNSTLGTSAVNLPLSSRVYITGNVASPCPHCVSGTCTYGDNAGKACTTTADSLTTQQCPPALNGFQAPLPVALNPLTTGASSRTAADGNFCPMQRTAGAIGKATAQNIHQSGTPAGNITDMAPHPAVLAYVFCIPATGSPAVDGVADLPGPGATSLSGNVQLH
jgi:hypothetical protein